MELIQRSFSANFVVGFFFLMIIFAPNFLLAQTGNIIEFGDQVLDPNQDGFTSQTDAGFNGDGYDVDEFEIKMFGIPIFGDGEALKDTQAGEPCGVSDLALDTAGFALYAGLDADENLIFRFRVAGDKPSVQSYSVMIDTDQLMGNDDPNSSSINPGFEIEVTLIHRFGIYIYDIDGIDSCPTPLVSYDVNTHQQKSVSSLQSCDDSDVFIDFYVPFSDLENFFGITTTTDIRFAGLTNISATCALDGKISDIGGVDDTQYDGCFACAMLDLASTQCPSSVSNLCDTCAGFPLGSTETPAINLPVIVGDINISGTSEPEAEVYIDLFSGAGILLDQDTATADLLGDWTSSDFTNPMTFEDSVVVNAKLPARCESGFNNSGLNFAIVSPNQPPIISGTNLALPYEENSPPIVIVSDLLITDDNIEMVSASVSISANYQLGSDILDATTLTGISMSFSQPDGILSFAGTASVADYIAILQSVTYVNTSDAPDFSIRTISFNVSDIINTSPNFDRDLLVEPVNDPPEIIIGNSSATDTLFVTTPEDTPFEICITASDVEQDILTITSKVVAGGQGIVTSTSDLCFLFTPIENYNGNEFVTIEVCDNGSPALCDTAVVAIEITPVNDPPVIKKNGESIDSLFFKITRLEDLSFCLTGFDIDGDNVHFDNATNLNGTASILAWENDLCFSYNSEDNFLGKDEFNVVFCDDGIPSKCVLVYIEIEVIDSNRAPIITDPTDTLYVVLSKNNSVEVCIPATDPDNDELSIDSIEELLGVGGSVTSSFPCLNYTPPLDFVGTDILKVFICDNLVNPLCDSVIVKFDVQPFNNPPDVIDEDKQAVDTVFVSTKENTPLEFCLAFFDPDNDNVVISIAEIDSSTPFGAIILDGDSCLIYEPGIDNVGIVEIDVTICDNGDPMECTNVVIIIDVLPVNEAPLIVNENGNSVDTLYLQTSANTALEYCIDAIDPDGDPITIENIETILSGGIYVPQSGSLCLEFIPALDYLGDDIHLITICDNAIPAKCDSVYVKIEIVLENTAPTFLNDGIPADTILFSTDENVPIDFCLDYSDPEGDNIILDAFDLVSGDGSFIRNTGELCFSYNPAINYFGNTWLTVSICDDAIIPLCANVVIGVEVKNINQKPDILLSGAVTDTLLYRVQARKPLSACIDVVDKDGDVVAISTVDNVDSNSPSMLSISSPLCFDFTPGDEFLGTEWYTLEVCDDGLPSLCSSVAVGIEVYSINTSPVIKYKGADEDSISTSITEGDLLILDLELVDFENDGLQISKSQIDVGGGVLESLLSSQLQVNYQPDVGIAGLHQIVVGVCDDGLPSLCDSIVVLIDVIRQNTAPSAADDEFKMYSNDELVGNILENDTDAEEDSLVVDISLTLGPEIGTLELEPTGDFNFVAPQDYLGSATFTYTICDIATTSLCSSAEVIINVDPRSLSPFQALSPNGDGYNDFWKIQGIEHFPDNQIRIFDRWNNMVFETEGYNNRDIVWKGEANRGLSKKDLKDGTYYYVVVPGSNEETMSGMVILKR
jgi:gliding motility-associated-like protein